MTVTINDENDTEIKITGKFRRGMKGTRDKFGVQLEPDDEPEMEILEAIDQYGNTRDLSKDQEIRAMAALWQSLEL